MVLNGGSSSGKTTLARALQETLPGIWSLFGIDAFLWATPQHLHGDADCFKNTDGDVQIGLRFAELYRHWRQAVAAFVRDGGNVILDEVSLYGGDDQRAWQQALGDIPMVWVGIRCPADEAERRERARGDRNIGLARNQADRCHDGVAYALVVDTSQSTNEQIVAAIVELLAA